MLLRKRLAFGLAAAATLGLTGCNSSSEVRAKITVEVDTPSGVRTGVGVWSWKLSKTSKVSGAPYLGKFRAEAVPVRLPDGQTLFVLATNQEMLAERLFRDFGPGPLGNDRIANVRAIGKRIGTTRLLNCSNANSDDDDAESRKPIICPQMVKFRRLDNPASAERVYPSRLQESLGPGFQLRSIKVQITDDPVNLGIESLFPWWANYKVKHFDGSSTRIENLTDGDILGHLSSGSFSTEFDQ